MAKYTFTEAEYLRGCAEIQKKHFLIKVILILIISFYLGFVVANPPALVSKFAIAIALAGAMIGLRFYLQRRRLRQVFIKQEAGVNETSMKVESERVYIESKRGNVTFEPKHLFKVDERREFFLLYSQKSLAVIVPKRALSVDETSKMREFAKQVS